MPTQTAGLNIELTAEVARAVANLRNVNDEFERMGDEAKKALGEAQGAINDLSGGTVSINRLSRALDVFRVAAQNATDVDSLREYNRSIQLLETELHRLNQEGRNLNNNLPGAGRTVNQATGALTDLGRVASDLPFGFIAIQNNIDPLISSFSRMFSSAGGLAGGFRSLGSALIGGAGLGLAFSLVNSAITVGIQKYGSLGAAIDAVFGSTTALEREQKLFGDALLKGAQDAQTNVVGLDNLYKAATNVNIPLRERNLIADELQKRYPRIFGNLTNEAILAGQAAGAYKNLRDQLVAVATAEAFKEEQVKQAQELLKLQREETKLRTDSLKAVERLDEAQRTLANSQGLTVGGTSNTVQYGAAVSAAALKVDSYTKKLKENATAQGEIRQLQQDLAKQQQDLAGQFGAAVFGIEPEKTKTNVKTVQDIINELNKDITALNSKFLATGGSLRDLTEDKLKAFGNAIAALSNLGIGSGNSVFDALLRDVTSLQNVLNTPKPIKIPVTIDPLPAASNQNSIAMIMKHFSDQFHPQLNQFTKDINKMIESTITNGIGEVAAGIGTAFATGNFGAVLGAFANVISGFLTNLGKTLIANGLAIEAFKKSLQSLQGIPAIVAGGALIAAASAFRSLAGKGINAFATGGFAMGPQLALIGDNPGRKEMIVPSEDFDKLGGGGDFTVTTRLSGQDILLVVQRAGRELRRFN